MCREDGKGTCERQSVTYDIKCAECNDIYIGETSRSMYTRGKRTHEVTGQKGREVSLMEAL